MAPMNLIFETEIGVTGNAQDGVDNSGASKAKLYSTPEDVYKFYEGLSPISDKFMIAAAKTGVEKPLFLVFHGGSGSTKEEITAAVSNGIVKMNVSTDIEWAYWEGVLNFYKAKEPYLQGQLGNPDGEDKPNKSYYGVRKWTRESELSMIERVKESCADVNNTNTSEESRNKKAKCTPSS